MREFVQRQQEAREHESWFRAEVQKALDDPRPGIPHETVMDETRALIGKVKAKRARA